MSARRPSRSTRRCRRCAVRPQPRPQREGLAIAAAGTHPFARPEAQPIVKEERYVTFVGYGGDLGAPPGRARAARARRDAVGRRLLALPRARSLPWLPVVLALSANSPWFAGVAERDGVEPRARSSPSCRGPARRRRSRRTASGRHGSSGSPARCRRGLHAHLVGRPSASEARHARGAHRPTSRRTSASSAAFAALLQALCATALAGGLPSTELLLADRGRADYSQNRWSARASARAPS